MEELDLLKKDWKRKENSFSQVSEKEIYGMIHRKSSSIVKWILIISILEVIAWTALGFVFGTDDYFERNQAENFKTFVKIVNWVNYAVILVFIYLFYKNYVTISTTASTRKLMKDILKTRKTVKFYVWYNLLMIVFSFIVGIVWNLMINPDMERFREKMLDDNQIMLATIGVLLLVIAAAVCIFWLFYRLLYGILLRKLLANYRELKKIDFE